MDHYERDINENPYQYKDNEKYSQLDNDWINEFEKIDKDYQGFYNEDLHFLKIHSIYINQQNEIEQLKEEKMFLNKGINKISREQLLGILKVNAFNCGKRYSILSIIKYNVDLHSSEIKDYLKNGRETNGGETNGRETNGGDFLSIIKNIDDIVFNQTINMFQDLNDVILLFYEKPQEEQYSIGIVNSQTRSGSLTKKVYINSNYGHKNKHKYTNKYRKTT
jgi:hypothetical protein